MNNGGQSRQACRLPARCGAGHGCPGEPDRAAIVVLGAAPVFTLVMVMLTLAAFLPASRVAVSYAD